MNPVPAALVPAQAVGRGGLAARPGGDLLQQAGLEPEQAGLIVVMILLLIPVVVGLLALSAAWALRQVQSSKTVADIAIATLAVGLTFQGFLIGWLVFTRRYMDFLFWPPAGDAALYLSVIVGLAMGFLVIWLSVLHALVQQAGAHASEVEEVNRKLRHRTQELEEFSYAVSHDLKSPLISLQWLVDELNQEPQKEERERLTARIDGKVSQMTSLVEDLLLLAQVEREGAVEETEPVLQAVGHAKEALAPLSRRRQVHIDADRAAGAVVNLPGVRLRQVLQNLVSNAIVHGRENGRVRISCQPAEQEGLVLLEVADDGPGIPEHEREQVFMSFTRGSGSNATEGSGIGLALVRKIARAYGGRAWVEDAPEGGANLCVLLPGGFVDAPAFRPGDGEEQIRLRPTGARAT